MIYGSVCSGIEACTAAWHPLGWQPAFFSEIEPFPSAVLKHHYPHVPNHGDMTKFKDWPDHAIDLLVGGTPCQSFSVAGLRKGMADPRGNLALVFLAIADRYRPEWLCWENVPGVLSSSGGRDFGSFLGGLGELGYGFAYRVLDAQHVRTQSHPRAVPQRRRRVFVVGHLGDWRRAAAVLFERESLSGNPAPSRKAGQGTSVSVAPSLVSSGRGVERTGETRGQDPVVACDGGLLAFGGNDTRGPIEVATARNGHAGPHGRLDFESETFVAHTLEATAGRSRGAGTPVGMLTADHAAAGYMVPVAIQGAATRENPASGPDGIGVRQDGAAYTVEARQEVQAVAFDMRGREGGSQFEGPHDTANIRAANGGSSKSYVQQQFAVRRLTPLECERLQGFPDGYTAVPYRGKLAADGPRYKALGNSMAVNCMRWLGERIESVHAMQKALAA